MCNVKLETQTLESKKETVDSHYKGMPVEPLDLMQTLLTAEEYQGFLKGNAIKYALRAGRKPGESAEKDAAKYHAYKRFLAGLEG